MYNSHLRMELKPQKIVFVNYDIAKRLLDDTHALTQNPLDIQYSALLPPATLETASKAAMGAAYAVIADALHLKPEDIPQPLPHKIQNALTDHWVVEKDFFAGTNKTDRWVRIKTPANKSPIEIITQGAIRAEICYSSPHRFKQNDAYRLFEVLGVRENSEFQIRLAPSGQRLADSRFLDNELDATMSQLEVALDKYVMPFAVTR
jgi:hypothetical protein